LESDYTKANNNRCRGLVILLLLLVCFTACYNWPAESERIIEPDDWPLKTKEEILTDHTGYLYNNPVIYLFFLPGPLFLAIVFVLKKKKILKFPLLIILLAMNLGAQDDVSNLLDNGAKLYKAHDFEAALTTFIKAEDSLKANASLQLNIAHCYYKLDKIGQTIFILKKALALNCADTAVRGFLKSIETEFNLSSQVNTNPYFHPDIPFLALIVFFNFSCILFFFLYKFRKGIWVIIFVFSVLLALSAAGVFIFGLAHNHQKIGIIYNDSASIRQIPEDTGREQIKVKPGTIVRIIWEMDNYVFIETGKGLKGWIVSELVLVGR